MNPAEEGIMAIPLVPALPLKREENASAFLLTALNAVSNVKVKPEANLKREFNP